MSVPERSSRTPVGGEVGYYGCRVVEALGSSGLRVDPVDQKRNVQYHQGEDNIRSVESAIEYVRETVGYEEDVFDAGREESQI